MRPSVTFVPTGPIALPLPLVQAQFLCFQKTAVMDLRKTARAVLSGILAFVSVHTPSKKIWPKRETLRLQCHLNSDSSLYRGLSELEEKGYVLREAQLHHARNGRFHISRIGLTEKAINLLNLGDKKLIHNQPTRKMADGHMKNLVNNTASKEESSFQEKFSKNPRIDPQTRLPKPLVKLTTLGLSPKTICWLMREAKQHQKRLEDVMNYAWRYLEPLAIKGSKNIKAYLRALIGKEQDFAFLLKQTQDVAKKQHATHTNRNMCEYAIKNQQGYYLINKNNQPIGQIDGEAIRWFANEKTHGIERWSSIWQINFHKLHESITIRYR